MCSNAAFLLLVGVLLHLTNLKLMDFILCFGISRWSLGLKMSVFSPANSSPCSLLLVPTEPLLCKFADGGQKKRQNQGKYLQNGRPWPRESEAVSRVGNLNFVISFVSQIIRLLEIYRSSPSALYCFVHLVSVWACSWTAVGKSAWTHATVCALDWSAQV